MLVRCGSAAVLHTRNTKRQFCKYFAAMYNVDFVRYILPSLRFIQLLTKLMFWDKIAIKKKTEHSKFENFAAHNVATFHHTFTICSTTVLGVTQNTTITGGLVAKNLVRVSKRLSTASKNENCNSGAHDSFDATKIQKRCAVVSPFLPQNNSMQYNKNREVKI